jgi:membrane-bound lytic murein transglycosylase D
MLVEAEAPFRYRVKSGDVLGTIAQKYGVYVSQIKRWNNLKSNTIRVGQRLMIYPRRFPKSTSSASNSKQKFYTVRSGDSLWSISKKFNGISFEDLKRWNAHLGSNIVPGTKVLLCNCTP